MLWSNGIFFIIKNNSFDDIVKLLEGLGCQNVTQPGKRDDVNVKHIGNRRSKGSHFTWETACAKRGLGYKFQIWRSHRPGTNDKYMSSEAMRRSKMLIYYSLKFIFETLKNKLKVEPEKQEEKLNTKFKLK